MNKIGIAKGFRQSQKIKLFTFLFLSAVGSLGIGFKDENILLILLGLIPASILGFLIYLNYKKDIEFTECINDLRQGKIAIEKSFKMQDGEILLLSKDGVIPKKGFKNLICVNLRRNEIFWIARLISEVDEKYDDFEIVNNLIEAVTSKNFHATINPDSGEVIDSRFKNIE